MLLDMPCPCLFMDMILVHRMLVTYRIKQVSKGCPPPQIPRSRYLFKRATQKYRDCVFDNLPFFI